MTSPFQSRVLIVDDDHQTLVSTAGALNKLSIKIDKASNAKEAIYLIGKQKYALMIFDVHMPEMDGFQLADIIKNGYHNQRTPIIFVSGVYFDEFSIFKGYRNGAVDYLTKPINNEILESKVQVFLELENTRLQLEEARNKVQETLENKTLFLGKVSHEIRNPLGLLISIIDQMGENIQPDELKDYMKILKSSSEHMSRLLDDLVDFSKMEVETIELESRKFNLREEIKHIIQAFQTSSHISKNKYSYEIQDNIPDEMIGDITRYRQIIFNLLGNANKLTNEGKIKLTISTIKIGRTFVELCTQITDNGIGMTDEEMKQLFIPFSQSRDDISRKYGGSGLGLAIAKKLSEMMGGQIQVESEKKKGSDFSFSVRFEI